MSQFTSTWARRGTPLVLAAAGVGLLFGLSDGAPKGNSGNGNGEGSIVQAGFAIAPVTLDMQGKNPDLVGLGSYLVNAQGGCSDCHTWPNFVAGGSPYLGQPEQINTAVYLGGGRPFGPVIVSDNLTPDPVTGLPAGMTLDEFVFVMRTGADRDGSLPLVPSPTNDLLQVMPWPVFRNLSDRELAAIYEYLSAIPSVP
jgi:hypothetical protein